MIFKIFILKTVVFLTIILFLMFPSLFYNTDVFSRNIYLKKTKKTLWTFFIIKRFLCFKYNNRDDHSGEHVSQRIRLFCCHLNLQWLFKRLSRAPHILSRVLNFSENVFISYECGPSFGYESQFLGFRRSSNRIELGLSSTNS